MQAYTAQRLAVLSDSVTQRGAERTSTQKRSNGVASFLPAPRAQSMQGRWGRHCIDWVKGAAVAHLL